MPSYFFPNSHGCNMFLQSLQNDDFFSILSQVVQHHKIFLKDFRNQASQQRCQSHQLVIHTDVEYSVYRVVSRGNDHCFLKLESYLVCVVGSASGDINCIDQMVIFPNALNCCCLVQKTEELFLQRWKCSLVTFHTASAS